MSNFMKDVVGVEDLSISASGGMRFNKNKPRLSTVPAEVEEAIAEVFWASCDENGGKYPMHNWKKGLPWTETCDSALRHIKAFAHGEDTDKESGMHHLKHAATNIAMLLYFVSREKYEQFDNRDSD